MLSLLGPFACHEFAHGVLKGDGRKLFFGAEVRDFVHARSACCPQEGSNPRKCATHVARIPFYHLPTGLSRSDKPWTTYEKLQAW